MTFDRDYFERFYEKTATRVYGAKEVSNLARGVVSMVRWFGGEIRNVLDVGAGAGLWRDWFRRHRPDVTYTSTDVSAYACERYGHDQRDISQWRSRKKFDLIICHGVLPYLDDAAASKAIENLAAMSRGFLYLEAITQRDMREVCDHEKTDGAMRARTGRWYRARLTPHFTTLGCGLFCRRGSGFVFYELEKQD